MLLEALLNSNDLDSIANIMELEEESLSYQYDHPYLQTELGRYYQLKGAYLIKTGLFDEGMEAYLLQQMLFPNLMKQTTSLQSQTEKSQSPLPV